MAKLAGMEATFATITDVDVVERYPGTGSTDFWGISFAFSSVDQQALSGEAVEHEVTLLRAAGRFSTRYARVCRLSCRRARAAEGGIGTASSVMSLPTSRDWAKGLGMHTPDDAMLTGEELKAHRDAYCQAIRDYHS